MTAPEAKFTRKPKLQDYNCLGIESTKLEEM